MQSPNLNNTQSEAAVCPVGDFVGNLCPWCGEVLPPSKTKPRIYCNEAHEKRFKRAVCKSKKECEKLEQLAIDYWLRYFNRNRAFSTFGTHNPMTELPTNKQVKNFERGYRPCACPKEEVVSIVTEQERANPPEPTPIEVPQSRGQGMGGLKPNRNTVRTSLVRAKLNKPKTNWCADCAEYVPQSHKHQVT